MNVSSEPRERVPLIFLSLNRDNLKNSKSLNIFLQIMEENNISKNSKLLFRALKKSAKQGNEYSQFQVAFNYYLGNGVKLNKDKAERYYFLAANQGLSYAQYNLAIMYKKDGNLVEAFRYLKMAAEANHAEALYQLAFMYKLGEGTAKNLRKALDFFQKAAEQNHVEACWIAALMHDKGKGTTQNCERALSYYKKAAKQGHMDATWNLAIMYENGEGTEVNLEKAFSCYFWLATQTLIATYNRVIFAIIFSRKLHKNDKVILF